MLISILQDHQHKIILDTSDYIGISASGLPRGVFLITGVTPTISGEFESHRWNTRTIGYSSTISIKLIVEGKPTKPDIIEKTLQLNYRRALKLYLRN